MPTRVISIANQKGGVGKTTTSVTLAFGVARSNKRVLLVDCDPQANTTTSVLGTEEPALTIYDLLARDAELEDVVMQTPEDGLDLIASEIDLAGIEAELVGQVGGQTLLRSKFRTKLFRRYDFVIIDTPPSLGLLTLNSLAASTEVLITVSMSFFATKGLTQLERTVELVRERLDTPKLRIGGVVCTLYDNTNVAADVHEAIQHRYGDLAFKTVIPRNIKVEEAHSRGMSVFDYAPESKGALAYQEFVKELISRG